MSGMNEYLAAHYGTASATSSQAASEDVEKQAQVELFAKLAADNNIDLSTLSDEQVTNLWNDFQKTASEGEKEEKKEESKEEKMEEAKKEHEEKKEAAAKLAEADFLGRVMAHSYVDELKKIASSQEPEGTQVSEQEDGKEAAARDVLHAVRNAPEKVKEHLPHVLHSLRNAPQKLKEEMPRKLHEARAAVNRGVEKAKAHPGATHGVAAGVGVAGGAGAMHAAKKEKKASALDELACESALQKAAEAGFDLDEASTRINAVLQLPMAENTKVAYAADLATAIDVRSLELLEMAGYPVTWNNS